MPYYLPVDKGRRDGFMPVQRNEMQTASSRIWTQVTGSISYAHNHNAKCASNGICKYYMAIYWMVNVSIAYLYSFFHIAEIFFIQPF